MKKEKTITKEEAIEKLKAFGLTEKDAIGTINIRLKTLNATRKREAIDIILAQIEGEEK